MERPERGVWASGSEPPASSLARPQFQLLGGQSGARRKMASASEWGREMAALPCALYMAHCAFLCIWATKRTHKFRFKKKKWTFLEEMKSTLRDVTRSITAI